MAPTARRTRRCPKTGLRLVPSKGQPGFRTTRSSRLPLDPPLRGDSSESVETWGRFDTYSGRTVYIGDTKRTTYCEVIAYQAPKVGKWPEKLSEVFDDTDGGDPVTLFNTIASEWDNLFRITPTKIVQGWRAARCLHHMVLPFDGWLIDIGHADTLRALNKGLAVDIGNLGIRRLTTEHLVGEDRQVTVMAASWLRSLTLFDGSEAHGIQFRSKHGSQGIGRAHV